MQRRVRTETDKIGKIHQERHLRVPFSFTVNEEADWGSLRTQACRALRFVLLASTRCFLMGLAPADYDAGTVSLQQLFHACHENQEPPRLSF
jgi:hypothetical protein